MKRVARVGVLVALSVLVVGSVVASAAGFLGRGCVGSDGLGIGGWLGRLSDHLDLTSDQQQELLKIRQEHAVQTLELRFELQQKMLELQQLWNADELDEEAISQKAGEIAALRVRLKEAQQILAEKEKQVLTPEQQKKLEKLTAALTDESYSRERFYDRMRTYVRQRTGRGDVRLPVVPDWPRP